MIKLMKSKGERSIKLSFSEVKMINNAIKLELHCERLLQSQIIIIKNVPCNRD